MSEKFQFSADLTIEQTRAAMMTFLTCYQQAVINISKTQGPSAAADFHRSIIAAVKNADISMPLDDEAKTFQFVVTMLENIVST
ncbi:hypothetical protein [Bradyrhizobium sp. STM 3561]|uniref:hypothetical protein n=1 Tax=Bradyrhizobium sp. STM 3561 TaxID=578923 RepID=UPI00388D9E07